MSIDKVKQPAVRTDITVQLIGDEVMLYDSIGAKIHVLNHSAYAIWKLCNGENTVFDIRAKMSAQFPDAGQELDADIDDTIDDFMQKGLLFLI